MRLFFLSRWLLLVDVVVTFSPAFALPLIQDVERSFDLTAVERRVCATEIVIDRDAVIVGATRNGHRRWNLEERHQTALSESAAGWF